MGKISLIIGISYPISICLSLIYLITGFNLILSVQGFPFNYTYYVMFLNIGGFVRIAISSITFILIGLFLYYLKSIEENSTLIEGKNIFSNLFIAFLLSISNFVILNLMNRTGLYWQIMNALQDAVGYYFAYYLYNLISYSLSAMFIIPSIIFSYRGWNNFEKIFLNLPSLNYGQRSYVKSIKSIKLGYVISIIGVTYPFTSLSISLSFSFLPQNLLTYYIVLFNAYLPLSQFSQIAVSILFCIGYFNLSKFLIEDKNPNMVEVK